MRNYIAAMGGVGVGIGLNAIPVIRASGTASSGAAAVTPSLPAGHTTNDILLCFVQSSNEAIAAPTNSGAGTWAEVTNSPQGIGTGATAGSVRLGVFWMRDTGASIGTVTVADTGNHTIAYINAYSGCLTSGNPWNATVGQTETGTTTTVTFPTLISTIGNCHFVYAAANAVDSTTGQFLSAFSVGNFPTDVYEGPGVTNTTSGTGGGIDVEGFDLANSGSSGTVIWTMSGSSANYAEMVIALTSN